MLDHDRDLAQAFDGQASKFERAPLQSDRGALDRLVAFLALPRGARVLDAGCGPGLVAEAMLEVGHSVCGLDLSAEMVRRARARCARFGDRARFEQGSVLETLAEGDFDASVSRFVLHHVEDPLAFVRAQTRFVRRGGVVVAVDHVTDPDSRRAAWHQAIERSRDRTHTNNLTPGGLADLFTAAGLYRLRLVEELYELDFDEWFDRGTPARSKAEVRAMVLTGRARGFDPVPRPDGTIALQEAIVAVRGETPEP